ncbi:alpha/beta hydrolase [Aureimonas fodinaquatilis]|uniref:Alpha/beta hydrolase n=1 Tax=Aureimonas fodinaquatilis TaxID=2565783 RepID=A0A5B0E160_9HYPH|nr:alpha/beta hydrolase [Aureimonas fodinaquatilis]KAA0971701.1 alpha/beta hydrolase [Aureimonas fodinaquatilis]
MSHVPPADFLTVKSDNGSHRLAFLQVVGDGPTIVWLGGFRSDMRGSKAERLAEFCQSNGRSYLRFDYSGHGESDGRFVDGTISQWTADARAMIEARTSGPLILVGSSMGGWISLLLARQLAGRVNAMLLLAPAPDFTTKLVEPSLTQREREDLVGQGYVARASEYSPEPTIYTQKLMQDGLTQSLMTGPIDTGCPVHIIQGMADPDVPYTHALELTEHLPGDGVVLTLVKDGDHRLSRDEDLARMEEAVKNLL